MDISSIPPIDRVKAARDLVGEAQARIAPDTAPDGAAIGNALSLVGDAVFELEQVSAAASAGATDGPVLGERAALLTAEATQQARAGLTLLDLEHAGVSLPALAGGASGARDAAAASALQGSGADALGIADAARVLVVVPGDVATPPAEGGVRPGVENPGVAGSLPGATPVPDQGGAGEPPATDAAGDPTAADAAVIDAGHGSPTGDGSADQLPAPDTQAAQDAMLTGAPSDTFDENGMPTGVQGPAGSPGDADGAVGSSAPAAPAPGSPAPDAPTPGSPAPAAPTPGSPAPDVPLVGDGMRTIPIGSLSDLLRVLAAGQPLSSEPSGLERARISLDRSERLLDQALVAQRQDDGALARSLGRHGLMDLKNDPDAAAPPAAPDAAAAAAAGTQGATASGGGDAAPEPAASATIPAAAPALHASRRLRSM